MSWDSISTGRYAAALSDASPLFSDSCGMCLEIRCQVSKILSSQNASCAWALSFQQHCTCSKTIKLITLHVLLDVPYASRHLWGTNTLSHTSAWPLAERPIQGRLWREPGQEQLVQRQPEYFCNCCRRMSLRIVSRRGIHKRPSFPRLLLAATLLHLA
jgi:hypothetical protein